MFKDLLTENKTKAASPRQLQITREYLDKLNSHIEDLKQGKAHRALEINEFADMLHIHPVHLSNTIKEVTGQSTCSHYESRLVNASKELLLQSNDSIKQIAIRLTYDPSNFTKFFKHFVGISPKQFRQANKI